MEEQKKQKIESLLIRGLTPIEISKIMKDTTLEEIEGVEIPEDLQKKSDKLYSELQRDLSKIVLKEMSKKDSDNNLILNSVKLSFELQEKKLSLNKLGDKTHKIQKEYIHERDEEIVKLLNAGISEDEISKKFKISVLSVKNSLDRVNLKLTDELKTISPSIISETKSLDKETRMKILKRAYDNNLTRKEVRSIVNEIKNNSR